MSGSTRLLRTALAMAISFLSAMGLGCAQKANETERALQPAPEQFRQLGERTPVRFTLDLPKGWRATHGSVLSGESFEGKAVLSFAEGHTLQFDAYRFKDRADYQDLVDRPVFWTESFTTADGLEGRLHFTQMQPSAGDSMLLVIVAQIADPETYTFINIINKPVVSEHGTARPLAPDEMEAVRRVIRSIRIVGGDSE
jgi:hypothetical protein